jgi:hypothetical protein
VGRITVLDGLRGACLIFMTLTHLEFGRGYALGYTHFKHLGFADSAQAFIFLSGLLVGLVGMRQYTREGIEQVALRYRGRALQLYAWHLLLLLLLLLASRLLPGAWTAWGSWLQHLLDHGGSYAVASAGLLYQPTLLDILPQYMLYLLAAPLAIRLIAEGRTGFVVAGMIVIWLAVQMGLEDVPTGWIEGNLVIGGIAIALRSAFNPLGWQLAFFGGLAIGAILQRGDLKPEQIFPRDSRFLPQLALGLLIAFAALRLLVTLGLLDDATMANVGAAERRADLGVLPTLNFAALAYLIGWLMTVGPTIDEGWVQRLGAGARRIFEHPQLLCLGRHALPVFCYHVILMYSLRYVDARLGPIPDPWFSLIGVAAIASLFLVAKLLDSGQPVREMMPAAGRLTAR